MTRIWGNSESLAGGVALGRGVGLVMAVVGAEVGAEVGATTGAGPAGAGTGEAAVTTAEVAAAGSRRSAFVAVGKAVGGTLVWLLAKAPLSAFSTALPC